MAPHPLFSQFCGSLLAPNRLGKKKAIACTPQKLWFQKKLNPVPRLRLQLNLVRLPRRKRPVIFINLVDVNENC